MVGPIGKIAMVEPGLITEREIIPHRNLDTTLELFLQELPEDYRNLAIELKAFCRTP